VKDKMKLIEAAFGGGGKAARAAGVAYSTWYRWKACDTLDARAEATLNLLLKSDAVRELARIQEAVNG
jgi:hypothetical protein